MTNATAVARAQEALKYRKPRFHHWDGEDFDWSVGPGTLEMLGRLSIGARTSCECGAGASTVLFAASGSSHVAVSPDPLEHERVRTFCDEIGVSHSSVRFLEGQSAAILSRLPEERQFDLVFIDGRHSFPSPIVDWYNLSNRLRVGGHMVLDDLGIPSVAVVVAHMREDPAWQFVGEVEERAIVFRLIREEHSEDRWLEQSVHRAGFSIRGFDYDPPRSLPTRVRDRLRRVLSSDRD
jgi:hypothetical protein